MGEKKREEIDEKEREGDCGNFCENVWWVKINLGT